MRIITGSTGTTHVTSNDDGEFNQAIFGNGLIVFENGNQLSASIVDNNIIRVADGDLILQGRHALIDPNTTEDIVIETGTVGINRNDLIVARYVLDSATGYETITLEVLKGAETSGEAVDPEYTTGDIRTGDMLVEVPLYRVKIEGINIVTLEPLFEVTKDIMELIADLQKANSKLNSDKANALLVDTIVIDNISISKSEYFVYNNVNASKSGYGYPMGIIGFHIDNATTSGSGCSYASLIRAIPAGSTVGYTLANTGYGQVDIKVKLTLHVLYMKK